MRGLGIGGAMILACALAACGEQPSGEGAQSDAEALDVRAVMQQQVNPATLAIWDIGNNAMNDQGGLDPAKMDSAKWSTLTENATKLAEAGRAMAAARLFVAASDGNTTVAEGEIPMAEVQRALDADPEGFRQAAAAFADHAEKLAAAARGPDVAAAGDLVAGIDVACENCHAKYWYPEQQ
jgi:cytochrome c556